MEGWSHYDLYDKPEPVAQALARLVPFFQAHLSAADAVDRPEAVAAE